jgi:hypothetical protein
MKLRFIFIVIITFYPSCKKDTIDTNEQLINIVKHLQEGDIDNIKKDFYSDEYFDDLPNVEQTLKQYKLLIENLEIDKKENIILEEGKQIITSKYLPKDSILITTALIPLGVNLPSPVPPYFVELNFIIVENEIKLLGLKVSSTKMPPEINELVLENRIFIDKTHIKDVSLMYEGGYKNPLIFKRKESLYSDLGSQVQNLNALLDLINNAKIVKSQKETDTRRFNGDPELGIVNITLDNEYAWTVFTLISEENFKPETFYGTFELRYSKYLNLAATYWIEVENKELAKKLILDLCHSGENKRTEPKKSGKLEVTKK